MKKLILMVVAAGSALALGAAEGNMYGNQAQNEGLFVVPKKGEVRVDGKIDPDEWDLSGQIWSFADWDSREIYSVKTAAMWDQEALYLCFDWRDPLPLNSTVDPRDDPGHGWTADAIQLRTAANDHIDWITLWGFKGGRIPCVDISHSAKGTNPEDKTVEHSKFFTYAKKEGQTKLDFGVELAYQLAADGKATANGAQVTVDVPWSMLGLTAPVAGTKMRGDVGFITSDGNGEINTARVYRSNKVTNLVNDQPGEALLNPAAWSEVVFE